MTAPAIHSVTYDKDAYQAGDTVTATIKFASQNAGEKAVDATARITDPATGETSTATAPFKVTQPNPLGGEFSDTQGRDWQLRQTDYQTFAVFTATA